MSGRHPTLYTSRHTVEDKPKEDRAPTREWAPCPAVFGHFPHLPPTPKPHGLGAEVPRRDLRPYSIATRRVA